MPRCMICAKEREEEAVRGGICRTCADGVRREAAGEKRRERREAESALRRHGQDPSSSRDDPSSH